MKLPEDFIKRMQQLLGDEADAFFASYREPKAYGLRRNPLKWTVDDGKSLPFTLSPVGWAREGFYAVLEEQPGKHPLHEGGAYYIQEPSAMAVVSLLDPKPGDIVCDLCAAPGGKSTQIAGRLLGSGLLVSNEIVGARAKVLAQNLERFGAGNSVVCNETPQRLAEHFLHFFHKMVVDAPCSGEGMFRKDEGAIREWSAGQTKVCAERQKMILDCADKMLAPGGAMVYSTCTFSVEEDEDVTAWFLEHHPNYTLEDWRDFLPQDCGLSDGRIPGTLRLFPHRLRGEGHFAVRLKKAGELPDSELSEKKPSKKKRTAKRQTSVREEYQAFAEQFLREPKRSDTYWASALLRESACLHSFGDELYYQPAQLPPMDGIRMASLGLAVGTHKKNRFEPAHALAMALRPEEVVQYQECDEETARRYLRGETISCDSAFRSWTLVGHRCISLGWGKAQNGVLKNHYPKGLRLPY